MKTLINILESLDTLYHFTDGRALVNILKTDTFMFTEGDSISKGYKFFMSTTRVPCPKTGYPQAMISNDICRIVLDGRKLNSIYKIKSVDWGQGSKNLAIRSFYDNPEQDFDKYKAERMKQTNVEAEDRVFSNKPEIKKFSRFIQRIDINTDTIHPKDAEEIIKHCERLGIDLHICMDAREFEMLH